MKYLIGKPGWKVAARLGMDLKLAVEVMRDDEAGVYVATSPHLRGLIVEAETLDGLHAEVLAGISTLMEDMFPRPVNAPVETNMHIGAHCAA